MILIVNNLFECDKCFCEELKLAENLRLCKLCHIELSVRKKVKIEKKELSLIKGGKYLDGEINLRYTNNGENHNQGD